VRKRKVLAKALGVERAVVLGLDEHDGVFVLRVRVRRGDEWRCPVCRRKCGRYDSPEGPRRWRAHDFGMMRLEIQASTPRVRCAEHGVHMAYVPWARMRSRFTRAFEDMVTWLAVRTDRTTVTHLLRIAWRTVGRILDRVSVEAEATRPPLKGLRRIGIDEVSYRKGHRYLTIVVDHDTGNLIWAAPGRDAKTLRKFFRKLKKKGREGIELVSADAAKWIGQVVREMCPKAKLCIDPFHVVSWATKALDEVRRGMWRKLRKKGESDRAKALKGSRWALMKNPGDLNRKQKSKLRDIESDNRPLFLAYLMKEQLREVFQQRDWQGPFMLSDWIDWVMRSRCKPMKKVARSIRDNYHGICSALLNQLSNGRLESMNTKLKLLTRLAFGFHSHRPLIALAKLKLGGLCPPLPGVE
jgi:transposase